MRDIFLLIRHASVVNTKTTFLHAWLHPDGASPESTKKEGKLYLEKAAYLDFGCQTGQFFVFWRDSTESASFSVRLLLSLFDTFGFVRIVASSSLSYSSSANQPASLLSARFINFCRFWIAPKV